MLSSQQFSIGLLKAFWGWFLRVGIFLWIGPTWKCDLCRCASHVQCVNNGSIWWGLQDSFYTNVCDHNFCFCPLRTFCVWLRPCLVAALHYWFHWTSVTIRISEFLHVNSLADKTDKSFSLFRFHTKRQISLTHGGLFNSLIIKTYCDPREMV